MSGEKTYLAGFCFIKLVMLIGTWHRVFLTTNYLIWSTTSFTIQLVDFLRNVIVKFCDFEALIIQHTKFTINAKFQSIFNPFNLTEIILSPRLIW